MILEQRYDFGQRDSEGFSSDLFGRKILLFEIYI